MRLRHLAVFLIVLITSLSSHAQAPSVAGVHKLSATLGSKVGCPAEGIETGGSLSQGRPSAHQERDTLFVNGKTYGKNTSSWENAAQNGDASPDWHPLSASRDPSDECKAMSLGKSLGYVSYDTILEEGHIEFLGTQKANGHRCLEYDVKFASQVLKETKVCLGSSDDLPYRVMREDYTATYAYEPVAQLPVPEQTPAPSQ